MKVVLQQGIVGSARQLRTIRRQTHALQRKPVRLFQL
jgi:hypothetical protein